MTVNSFRVLVHQKFQAIGEILEVILEYLRF